jgi:DNA end-binding protein Ku
MARSIWSGALSFGLVNVPVKLYSAVSRKTVRFHQLNEQTGNRIAQKRVDSQTGDEVAYEQIVKGYELGRDRYVVVEPDELEALDPARTKTIDIEDFVELDQIDPVYYDHPYYLVPDKGAAKPYGLLLEAMRRSDKVAIARVVLRSKEQLVAIRPSGNVLLMETMIFHDEVVPADGLDDLPAEGDLSASDREVAMAEQLIASLSSEFEPSKYRDEYREKVLDLVERKAEGHAIAVQPEAPARAAVPDLMAALEASLAAVKGKGPASAADGDGDGHGEEDAAPKRKAPARATVSRARTRRRSASRPRCPTGRRARRRGRAPSPTHAPDRRSRAGR